MRRFEGFNDNGLLDAVNFERIRIVMRFDAGAQHRRTRDGGVHHSCNGLIDSISRLAVDHVGQIVEMVILFADISPRAPRVEL